MRILVWGGAGCIGSHTALEVVRAGHEVIVADNLLTGHRSAVPKQAKFYEGDIRDAAFLDKLFDAEKIDAVIHFAAFSLVASSEKAKRVLGWKPEHDSLEEIIASAWNLHTHHPNGYEE